MEWHNWSKSTGYICRTWKINKRHFHNCDWFHDDITGSRISSSTKKGRSSLPAHPPSIVSYPLQDLLKWYCMNLCRLRLIFIGKMKYRIAVSFIKSLIFISIKLQVVKVTDAPSICRAQQYWKSKARFLTPRSCGITCSTLIVTYDFGHIFG